MQNRTEQDVLEIYKNADQITKNQMWMRFPAFREAFDEFDGSPGNKWQVSGVVFRADCYIKEK
jgi:hypothetical protein